MTRKYTGITTMKGDILDYITIEIDYSKESELSKYLYHKPFFSENKK